MLKEVREEQVFTRRAHGTSGMRKNNRHGNTWKNIIDQFCPLKLKKIHITVENQNYIVQTFWQLQRKRRRVKGTIGWQAFYIPFEVVKYSFSLDYKKLNVNVVSLEQRLRRDIWRGKLKNPADSRHKQKMSRTVLTDYRAQYRKDVYSS